MIQAFRRILIPGFMLFTCWQGKAQDISFTAKAPEKVQAGEQFQVVYEINDRVKEFTPPSFDAFIFLSSRQGISTINWNTTQQFVYIFKAMEPGIYQVAPAQAKYKNTTIESNGLTIEVTAVQNSSQTTAVTSESATPPPSESGGDVFVRLLVDKTSSFVGEQIIATIKVYTKLQLSGIDNTFKGPDFTGFYVQNLQVPPLRSLEPEKVGGETYYSGVIRKAILLPQRSGEIIIDPFELLVQYDKKVRVGYFTTYQPQNVTVNSKPVKLNIKALPANKPAGFNGAIGDFSIEAGLSDSEVMANDAVVFSVVVKGNGNIKLLDEISYTLPATLEVFEPVVKTQLAENGLSGSKTFEITAIPRHAGDFVINPFELVYFNPQSGTYISKKTNSFILKVEKAEGDSNTLVASNLSRKEVELLESDIRFIKTQTNLVLKSSAYWIASIRFYLIILLGILLFALGLVWRREQIKRNINSASTKHKNASRMATRRLRIARKMLLQHNNEAFYSELSKALWDYIGDKLSLPRSELSTSLAAERLKYLKVDSALVEQLMGLIELCEYARYAPGAQGNKPEELIDEAGSILSRIEQYI